MAWPFTIFALFDCLHVLWLKRQSGAETSLALAETTRRGRNVKMTRGRIDQWPKRPGLKRLDGAESSTGRNVHKSFTETDPNTILSTDLF